MKPLAIDLFCGLFQAYLIACSITGRGYIGVTSRTIKQRWSEHFYDARQGVKGMAISRAITKYGAENFSIEPICSARSWQDICAMEAVLIMQNGTRAPNGYNLSDGGEGPFGVKRTAESVERSAAKHRGRPCHPNTRAASILTHKGRPKSAVTRARMAAARIGKPRTETTKEKLRVYWATRRVNGDFQTSKPYEHARKSVE